MSFEAHLARIWRRRFLVAAITLLAGLVAFGAAGRHSGTQYTGTATLITVSQNSSPDQTATLATGYVDTFIQPSFQDMLHAKLGLPADVSLTAQTAATEPDHLHIGDRPRRGHGAAGGRGCGRRVPPGGERQPSGRPG